MDERPPETEYDPKREKPRPALKPPGMGRGTVNTGPSNTPIAKDGQRDQSSGHGEEPPSANREIEKQQEIERQKQEEEFARDREAKLKEFENASDDAREAAMTDLAKSHDEQRKNMAQDHKRERVATRGLLDKRDLTKGFNTSAKKNEQGKDGPTKPTGREGR